MATGISSYSDISGLIDNIHEQALFTLRRQNKLLRTVRIFRGMGMAPRDVNVYNATNVRQVGEGEDVTPTQFTPSNLATLTPARYADQVMLTDQRIATDRENITADAALELGSNFANYVDTQIATNFSSLTGGTVGTAGSTLTWANIYAARAVMENNNVPMGPMGYFCALHPYQWNDLINSTLTSGNQIMPSDAFQDELIRGYWTATIMAGVTFVVTNAIAIDGSDDAIGAMYSPMAIAYDERKGFNIRPERDESREAVELNASLWFAHGVWRAATGVQIISDASTPS